MWDNFKSNYLLGSVLILFLLIAFFCYKSLDYPPHDFSNYYFAGKYFIEGKFDRSIYDPTTFNLKLLQEGYENFFVNFSPNSPFIALFFAPLSNLDIGSAKLLFNLINGFLFLFSLIRIIKYLGISNKPTLLLLPLICFIPIRNGILYGQFYMLLFSMLIEGYLLYKKGKLVPAMLLWVVPTALKIAPGILVIYLIGKKDFKSLAIFAVLGGLVLMSTGFLLSFDIFTFYLSNISPKVSLGEIVSAGFIPNQSPLMFFKYLFISDTVENQHLVANSKILFAAAMGITYALIIYVALINSSNKTSEKDFRTFGMWLLLIFIISPYGSSYSRILLVIIYLSVIQSEKFNKQILVGLLLMGIINFPYYYIHDWPIVFQFLGLYATIIVFGIIQDRQPVNRKHLIPIVLSVTLFSVYFYQTVRKRQEVGKYVLENNPSLILDYQLSNNRLSYTYWQGSEQVDGIDFPFEKWSESSVFIKNNQLYLGDQELTSSLDNKKKPILIGENKIVYLSDWGRGYGFYTLRVIEF